MASATDAKQLDNVLASEDRGAKAGSRNPVLTALMGNTKLADSDQTTGVGEMTRHRLKARLLRPPHCHVP